MTGALAKGARVTGAPRAELADELARRYTAGESIRAIADDTGRSFGFVHGLIKESVAVLRGRGGATRGAGVQAVRSAAPARKSASSAAGSGVGPNPATAGPVGATDSATNDSATNDSATNDRGKKSSKKEGSKKDSGKKDGGMKDSGMKDSGKKDSAKKDGKKVKKR